MLSAHLLGRHISQGPQNDPFLCQSGRILIECLTGSEEMTGDAEIQQFHPTGEGAAARQVDGETIAPTGKPFETCFTTIAKWKNDQIVEEYVMLDPRDIMNQVVA